MPRPLLASLVPLLLAPLLGGACTDKGTGLDSGDVDTGTPECGRIRGSEGVLMYQEDGNTVRSPLEAPNAADITTGVAGPLEDGLTYVAVESGRALVSVDAGCNWERQGSLPAGDWKLLGAGARVYAFDTLSAAGARSDDLGATWTPFDAVEPFVGGLPVVDAADPARLRGLQARGVVTSSDGGESWSVGAALPTGASALADSDLSSANLDYAVLGAANGGWYTNNAGASWTSIATDTVHAIAIHPDDDAVVFATTVDSASVITVSRSADRGATWARLTDSSQVALPTAPALWPVPGDTLKALTAFGPVFNDNTESDGVNLYIIRSGAGTRTVFVGTWFHLHQVTFGADRWVAAVDAAP